jgi:hypothetical protein
MWHLQIWSLAGVLPLCLAKSSVANNVHVGIEDVHVAKISISFSFKKITG